MKRIVALLALGFAGGLLAGTGFGAVRGRARAVALRDSVALAEATPDPGARPPDVVGNAGRGAQGADAARREAPVGGAEAVPDTSSDSSASVVDAGAPAEMEPSGTGPSPLSSTGPTRAATTSAAAERAGADSAAEAGPRRLAKIFGAMKPKDAAAVCLGLSDRDVKAILAHISDRKAAAILAELPPERAASLSRIVLGRVAGEIVSSPAPASALLDSVPAGDTARGPVSEGPATPSPAVAPDTVPLDSLQARAARLDSLIFPLPDDPFPVDTAGVHPVGQPWVR